MTKSLQKTQKIAGMWGKRMRTGDMKDEIGRICGELDFPAEGRQAMLDAWDAVSGCPEAADCFEKWIAAYGEDIHIDYKAALLEADEAAKRAGIREYTAEMLLFLCFAEPLKKRYEEKGIDDSIWKDSCMDLRWKLMECHKMYGIWGSFVAWWFPGFFDLTRFALGRLQFELIDFPADYEAAGRRKPEGMTKAINVHIPSCGKLKMEECHESYRRAAAFFADAFPDGRRAFACWSWMLYSPHRAFLKPDSGVVKFMSEYDVYATGEEDGDLWRIFNRMYDGRPDALPEDTSMQRGYKKWLQEGHHAGYGKGIFYYGKPGFSPYWEF
ncbi:MAG TPA: DUF5596 domain-containing protein [Candidatus Eisenbergiella pullicola]|nr:DUF5596 domain-containing protein [Candidatus Eisenbergiella pullicola]